MANRKSLAARLEDLAARLDEIEERLDCVLCDDEADGGGKQGDPGDTGQVGDAPRYCAVPCQPQREFGPEVSAERAFAILAIGNKWVNGTPLHYYFFTSGPFAGDSAQQDVVRRAFSVWKSVGIGLTFSEVSSPGSAEIRIGFRRGNGSWSNVGTQALNVGGNERTMNFGWNINVPGPNGLDTAIHEIGHALGFHHEHQNPNAGIVWNEQAVYDYFARTQDPPWDRATTDFNILRKINALTVDGTTWDPNSIMHYAFDRGLIREPEQYRNGLRPSGGLSAKDIEVVKRFYPETGTSTVVPELRTGESQFLSLAPGQQKDFNFLPAESRNYVFQTFGQSDTVIVLFEEDGSELRFVGGDDDSGYDRNAMIRVRLAQGRRYRLKVRLYYQTSSGNTSVMAW